MTAPGSGEPSPDWAVQAADRIEGFVGGLRGKTARPLEVVAKGVVYGLVAAVAAVTALVLLAVALVRALDIWIPGDVWRAHLIVGGLFTLAGVLAWSRRKPARKD